MLHGPPRPQVVDEIHHQSDYRHGTDENETQADSLLVTRQCFEAGVQQCEYTNESEDKNHHFLHKSGFIEIVHENITFQAGKSAKNGQEITCET